MRMISIRTAAVWKGASANDHCHLGHERKRKILAGNRHEVENQLHIEFAAALPFLRDAQLLIDSGGILRESEAPNAMRWRKQFKGLYERIQDDHFGGDDV